MRLGSFLASLAFAAFVAAGCAAAWFSLSLNAEKQIGENTLVYIAPGSPAGAIADLLAQKGAIDSPFVFTAGTRLIQLRDRTGLKAGEYLLPQTASAADIIRLLQSGKTYQRRLTVPEGLMSVEIVALINNAEGLTGTIDSLPAEGSLLPETYLYSYGMTRVDMVARMQKAMKDAVARLWPGRAGNLPFSTPEEAVTLASIVERETGVKAERARVAGVFVNRLRASMPLQSDPTAIYAITKGEKKFDRALYRRDLNIDSPYNTYMKAGLPPGPIANPGLESIAAVLNPEAHDYYYFVADGTGGHAFSKTLQEHAMNVEKWRRIKNAD
jgi:UPF0755 protein